jgi:hypothetical protein
MDAAQARSTKAFASNKATTKAPCRWLLVVSISHSSSALVMADGGRSERRLEKFTDDEARELDRAAKRMAKAFGYGDAWKNPTFERVETGQGMNERGGALRIAHRGRVSEKADGRLDDGTRIRQQRSWTRHGGVVALPSTRPDPAAQAALSYARLAKPLLHLLRAYALESIADWYAVEPFLHAIRPSSNAVIAGRDAMARIMFAGAATAIDARAQQLCIRSAAYREETRTAEAQLRAWLVTAAIRYNLAGSVYFDRVYPSQGNGFARSTFWNGSQATYLPNKRELLRTAGRNPTLQTA